MTLFSMVGTNFVSPTPINVEGLYGIVINYIWKIKVTQIDCGFNNPLRGMYFTANTFQGCSKGQKSGGAGSNAARRR